MPRTAVANDHRDDCAVSPAYLNLLLQQTTLLGCLAQGISHHAPGLVDGRIVIRILDDLGNRHLFLVPREEMIKRHTSPPSA